MSKGGLAFLNKKSWHTATVANVERVWKAEQRHAAEQKKLAELRKEIEEQRQIEDLRRLQEEAGLITKDHVERLNWMYEGVPDPSTTAEDYLLGKAVEVDSKQEDVNQLKDVAGSLLLEDKDKDEEVDATKAALEQASLLRNDPLMAIERLHHEQLTDIVTNPHKMKKIRQRLKLLKRLRKAQKELKRQMQRQSEPSSDVNTKRKHRKHKKSKRKKKHTKHKQKTEKRTSAARHHTHTHNKHDRHDRSGNVSANASESGGDSDRDTKRGANEHKKKSHGDQKSDKISNKYGLIFPNNKLPLFESSSSTPTALPPHITNTHINTRTHHNTSHNTAHSHNTHITHAHSHNTRTHSHASNTHTHTHKHTRSRSRSRSRSRTRRSSRKSRWGPRTTSRWDCRPARSRSPKSSPSPKTSRWDRRRATSRSPIRTRPSTHTRTRARIHTHPSLRSVVVSSSHQQHSFHDPVSTQRGMTQEERNNKIKEMMANASQRNKDGEERLRQHLELQKREEKEVKDAKKGTTRGDKPRFIRDMNKDLYGNSNESVQDRIKKYSHYRQKGSVEHHSFLRK